MSYQERFGWLGRGFGKSYFLFHAESIEIVVILEFRTLFTSILAIYSLNNVMLKELLKELDNLWSRNLLSCKDRRPQEVFM